MRALFGRNKRQPESVVEDSDSVRRRTTEKVLELAAAPYEAAREELESLHRDFVEQVARRRAVVDELRAAEARIAEVQAEIGTMPQKLTEAQLADDQAAVKDLQSTHRNIREDLQEVRAERDRAAAELEAMPEELELSAELARRAERIATSYGHSEAAFLEAAVRGQEQRGIAAVADAARRAASEDVARGAAPGHLTRTFNHAREVDARHRGYVNPPAGIEEQARVRFLRSNSPYAAGEIVGLDESAARKLAENGTVEIVEDQEVQHA